MVTEGGGDCVSVFSSTGDKLRSFGTHGTVCLSIRGSSEWWKFKTTSSALQEYSLTPYQGVG